MNFDYQFPYTSTRLPLFARNVVSTSHPLAAQAGLRMMLKGGNAVDAAIAAAAVITGAGSGVGQSTALKLAALGWTMKDGKETYTLSPLPSA